MISYFIEATVYLTLFASIYVFTFRKETFIHWNRFYLLFSFLGSTTLPLVSWSFRPILNSDKFSILLPEALVKVSNSIAAVNPTNESIGLSLIMIFSIVAFFIIIRMAVNIISILRLRSGTTELINGHQVYFINKNYAPFSFLNMIFISGQIDYSQDEIDQIICHEGAHCDHGHTLDNLIIEIFKTIFWWNPVYYFYKKSIKEIHEFQADNEVIKSYDPLSYGNLLISTSTANFSPILAHAFFDKPLKQRLIMMKKMQNPNPKYWKYLLLMPVLIVSLFIHSCTRDNAGKSDADTQVNIEESNSFNVDYIDTVITFDPATKKESMKVIKSTEEVFKKVDVMPLFPGCDDLAIDEQIKCSNQKMLTYIYSNIKYPQEAKDAGTEGMVVSSFIISKDGSVNNIAILKGPGRAMNEEVKRVMQKMADNIRWTPGEKDGKKVNVSFTLPVKFKLQ